jgi:DNA-directed RNA polymerase subunit RPC12/RpoP
MAWQSCHAGEGTLSTDINSWSHYSGIWMVFFSNTPDVMQLQRIRNCTGFFFKKIIDFPSIIITISLSLESSINDYHKIKGSETIMVKFCPTCGKPLQFENAEICPDCGVRIISPTTIKKQDSGRSVIVLIAAGIGILLLFLIIVAVIAAFVFGMSGNI